MVNYGLAKTTNEWRRAAGGRGEKKKRKREREIQRYRERYVYAQEGVPAWCVHARVSLVFVRVSVICVCGSAKLKSNRRPERDFERGIRMQ
jgi:hypothetical protein